MNVPALRFKDDDGQEFPEWEEKTLGDVAEIKRGAPSQHLNYVSESIYGIRLLRINDFLRNEPVYVEDTDNIKKFRVQTNDLLIAGTGATAGIVFRVPNEFNNMSFSYNAPRIRITKAYHGFIYFYLISDVILRQQRGLFVGNAQPFLDTNAMRGFVINVPSLPEQTKIANFLTAVDNKITLLTKKADLLSQYKKGVMQQIFSQELRFKDDDGQEFPEWEEKTLGEVSDRVIRKNKEDNKNVLTISAQYGLINQKEYFNKSVSAKILTNYYLLHLGDFAYNKSYSNGYPMGAIKCLNRYEKGVVSTLYICFKFKDSFLNKFFEQYFEAGLQNQEIEKVAQEGARNHGLLNIGLDDFFSIRLTIPSLQEQTKIANFLTAIDEKITKNQTQLDAVKQYKQGLLQQMFV